MNRNILYALIITAIAIICCVIYYGIPYLLFFYPTNHDRNLPSHQYDQYAEVQSLLNLSSLPIDHTNYTAYTSGNPFARSYQIEFDSSKSQIDNWINTSPCFRNAQIVYNDNVIIYYFVNAASFSTAEIDIDTTSCHVIILLTTS